MKTYTTIQGDCWDLVAFKIYGEEKYMKLLAEANLPLLDYMIFPPGTVINVQDIPDDYDTEETVFWRDEDDEDEEPYSSVEEDEEDDEPYSPVEEDEDE